MVTARVEYLAVACGMKRDERQGTRVWTRRNVEMVMICGDKWLSLVVRGFPSCLVSVSQPRRFEGDVHVFGGMTSTKTCQPTSHNDSNAYA